MGQNASVLASLLVFSFMSQVFWIYKYHFSGATFYFKQARLFERQWQQENLSHQLTQYEFEEFRQDVAARLASIPGAMDPGEKHFSLRTLASVVSKPTDAKVTGLMSHIRFEEARALFREKNLEKASDKLQEFVDKYSYSAHTVEAYFLLAESQFQLRRYSQAVHSIETMVTIFPANEMTGFSLLRLGQIFEAQERQQEAASIYKTVMQSFKDPQVVMQARLALRSLQ